MNLDFSAAVHPLLREVASGPPGTCATIELCADSSKWIQFVDLAINAAYPFEDAPEIRLPELLERPVILDVSSFIQGLDDQALDALSLYLEGKSSVIQSVAVYT